MIVAYTSGLLALLDAGEPDHDRCREAVKRARRPVATVDLVLAELDFLLLTRLGRSSEARFLAALAGGWPMRLEMSRDDLVRAVAIEEAYADQSFGLTDCVVMALAERLGAPVLTLDRRHFAVFRTEQGVALDLLP